MNTTSKISLPSTAVLNLYYYFTYFTLILTSLITPLLFYVILTQSKNLKSFKWFVLNHSFWSFMTELFLGLAKPVILTPAVAGFPLGIARENSSFEKTMILLIIGFAFGVNYNASFVATIANRYLTTFPSPLTNWITRKLIVVVTVGVSISVNGITVIAAVLTLSNGSSTVIQSAKEYDLFFEGLNETSLIFFPNEYVHKNLLYVCVISILLIFCGIGGIIFFSYTVSTSKYSTTTTKMQKSLILSSIFQILISVIFFGIPISTTITFMLFEIGHTSSWVCLALAMLSLHSFLESIATIYFVLPYRRFIAKQLSKGFSFRSSITAKKVNVTTVLTKIL